MCTAMLTGSFRVPPDRMTRTHTTRGSLRRKYQRLIWQIDDLPLPH
jgi:hypothetical protein